MLMYLNTGRTYKVSELAELLETNPRNIIEYKKELDEVAYYFGGFHIENISGRYGGYRLEGNALLPSFKLNLEEKDAFKEAFNYIQTKKDFVKKKEASSAFAKIMSQINMEEKNNDLLVVDHYQLQMQEKEITERYKMIEKAIKSKNTIEMEYNSLKNGTKINVVDPYKLFIYNNSWFFLGWDHEGCDVYYFKLNRIESIKILDKKFAVLKGFKAENYFDGNGFKNNGEFYHVEFLASGTRKMLMKERVYGKNQVVEDYDETRVKVSLDMQNKGAIISFALGCGLDIEILTPEWLKEEVRNISNELYNRYNK